MCQWHREGYVEHRGWLPGPCGRDQTQLNTKILDLCPCPHPALLSPNPTEVASESERQWACLGKDSSHQGGEEPAEQDGWSQCREVPKSEQRKKGFVGSQREGRGGWGLTLPSLPAGGSGVCPPPASFHGGPAAGASAISHTAPLPPPHRPRRQVTSTRAASAVQLKGLV